VSRNGRLNVWECDTRLGGLVKLDRDEDSNDENDDEDKKVDDDFLTNKKNKTNENQTDITDLEENKKKFYIAYLKKSK
jgi:hypothetical protein